MIRITAETLMSVDAASLGVWGLYKKKTRTQACRMQGPFEVETTEGIMKCEDGYLAIDARGYPYPIAKDEFDLIYEEVS